MWVLTKDFAVLKEWLPIEDFHLLYWGGSELFWTIDSFNDALHSIALEQPPWGRVSLLPHRQVSMWCCVDRFGRLRVERMSSTPNFLQPF